MINLNKKSFDREIGLPKTLSDMFLVVDGKVKTVDAAHVAMYYGSSILNDGGYNLPSKLEIAAKDKVQIESNDRMIINDGMEVIKIDEPVTSFPDMRVPPIEKFCNFSFISQCDVGQIVKFLKVAKKYTDYLTFDYVIGQFTIAYQDANVESQKGKMNIENSIGSGFPQTSMYPLEYLINIFKSIEKVDDKVDIMFPTDGPMKISGNGYAFLIAPRIEND
jgi:hypothetical protein